MMTAPLIAILCGLTGLAVIVLICIEDELTKIRQMMEEEEEQK